MERINKAAAAGVIFFMVILAGFVGIHIDQTTVALLGGAFIGLVVAIPTTVLIMVVGLRKPDAGQVKTPTQSQRVPDSMTWETHNHYHQHPTVILVHVERAPESMTAFEACTVVATRMKVNRRRAEELLNNGEVKLIEAPKPS